MEIFETKGGTERLTPYLYIYPTNAGTQMFKQKTYQEN